MIAGTSRRLALAVSLVAGGSIIRGEGFDLLPAVKNYPAHRGAYGSAQL
jgi:hypothetical protein